MATKKQEQWSWEKKCRQFGSTSRESRGRVQLSHHTGRALEREQQMPSAEAVSRKTGGWRYPVSWMTFPAPPGSCWNCLLLFLTSSGILTMNPKSPEHISFSGNPSEPSQHHVIFISLFWHVSGGIMMTCFYDSPWLDSLRSRTVLKTS